MIITDYNKMTVEELYIINNYIGSCYVIEDGRITGIYKEENKDA